MTGHGQPTARRGGVRSRFRHAAGQPPAPRASAEGGAGEVAAGGRRDAVVDCAVYLDGQRKATLPPREALREARSQPGAFAWIGLHEPDIGDLADIAAAFGLHPLAVESAVTTHQRPQLAQFGQTLLVVLKTIVFVDHDELTATSEVVDTGQIVVFLGADFVIVVRHGSAPGLARVRRALEARPDLLAEGPAAVLHAIADRVVDDYLDVADAVELDVEQLEADVFSSTRRDDAERIYQLKRELLEFKRAVIPLARPLQRLAEDPLPVVTPAVAKYLRDVADHLTHVRERLATATELVDGLLTAGLAQVGIQQNTDMRRISAAAAVVAIPTLVAGLYGMNFDHMPELHWTYGYPLMLTVTAAVSFTVYRAFRRNGWL